MLPNQTTCYIIVMIALAKRLLFSRDLSLGVRSRLRGGAKRAMYTTSTRHLESGACFDCRSHPYAYNQRLMHCSRVDNSTSWARMGRLIQSLFQCVR